MHANAVQKQPSRGVLKKRFSKSMQQIIGEHPYRSMISIKLLCNFICITIQHGCFTMCVCVCVCVCMCVCLYSFAVKASSVCKISKTYLRVRINDLVLLILVDCVMPSSIIAVSENVIFHLQRRKLQPLYYWRENNMI